MGMISETKTLHLGGQKLSYWLAILYTGRFCFEILGVKNRKFWKTKIAIL